MSSLLVTCRTCGTRYAPTYDQLVAGVWARSCPNCYPVERQPTTAPRPASTEPADQPEQVQP